MSAPRCVLLFRSIHDVMRAEKVLLAEGLWCDMVPVPRQLTSECGMAIEARFSDHPALEALRAASRLEWTSAWRAEGDRYAPLEATAP